MVANEFSNKVLTGCSRIFRKTCRMNNDKAANRHVNLLPMSVGRADIGVLTRMRKTQ